MSFMPLGVLFIQLRGSSQTEQVGVVQNTAKPHKHTRVQVRIALVGLSFHMHDCTLYSQRGASTLTGAVKATGETTVKAPKHTGVKVRTSNSCMIHITGH